MASLLGQFKTDAYHNKLKLNVFQSFKSNKMRTEQKKYVFMHVHSKEKKLNIESTKAVAIKVHVWVVEDGTSC